MPRRLKLSPMQRDIMLSIEEAGSEPVGTVFATVKPSSMASFSEELEGLVIRGLVEKGSEELVITADGIEALWK